MATLVDMQRVVFRHDWCDLAEWVRALDELADLTDSEIESLVPSSAILKRVRDAA
ncbi:MAG: hypothetical protein IPK66_01345 [Rhodospirillales bacterium]|nr:hypothetical protein [Rhodospirillales bacterium]